MSKKSPAPPPPPDYAAAAQQQGQANLEAARLTARLSNPNIRTPLGGQNVTFGRPQFNEKAYNAAMTDYNRRNPQGNAPPPFTNIGGGAQMPTGGVDAVEATPTVMPSGRDREFTMGDMMYRGPGQRAAQGYDPSFAQYGYTGDVMPTREMFTTMTDLDTPYIEQYLTPEAQATLDAQQRVDKSLANLGESAIGRVQNIFGQNFTPTGLPQQQFLLDRGALPTLPNLQGQAEGGPDAPTLQGQIDTRNLAAMPVNAGMTAQDAIMSRLDPQLQRQRAQLETQLANQGLVRGGEAYNAAMQEQGQRENDLRTQAALQGLQLDMAARQQGFGEAQALGGFANTAALGGFGAGQEAAAARNAALTANQQMRLQQAQAQAALQAQGFNQEQAAAAFQNAQRQAALQEQLALRNQPLNEITALMGASQVQMPQFQGYRGADVAAAPIFGASQAAGNFALQNYGNQVNAYNARMGLYSGLADGLGYAAGSGFFGKPFGGP